MSQTQYATLAALYASIIDTARGGIEEGANVPPLLILANVNPDGSLEGYSAMDADMYMQNERTKQAFAATMDGVMADESAPINALIFVSEAWMSEHDIPKDTPDRDERVAAARDLPPSMDPNRKECLIVVKRTRGLDDPASETRIFTIDRDNKTLIERVMPSDGKVGGRFTGAQSDD